MRVLVTGGSGLIGYHLCRELVENGHEVWSLSQTRGLDIAGVKSFQGDVSGNEARRTASQVEAVVHLAALSDASLSLRDPLAYGAINSQGTLNMLEGARQGGARFIFASSQRLYQPQRFPIKEDGQISPVDPYGYSKLVGENWVEMYERFYGVPATILRFFSVYGPGQQLSKGSSGVVTIFVRRALAGENLVIKGNVLRDFTYVSDATAGIRLVLDRPSSSGVFNIATGVTTTISDLAYLVREVTGVQAEIDEVPGNDDECYVGDISKARRELGYEPAIGLREGLSRYVDWMRKKS